MRSMRYTNIATSDLLYLFGIGEQVFEQWIKQGLPCEPGGRFSLSKVLRWLKERHRTELARALTPDRLSQQQLAALFAVTRQTVTAWGRAGLPRNPKDGNYDLAEVCQWLRSYYAACAERKYQARIKALRRKLTRNVKQLEWFLSVDDLAPSNLLGRKHNSNF